MNIDDVLRNFFAPFQDTVRLTDHLIAQSQNPQDILLLLCSRLDAMATAVAKGESQSKVAFVDFVLSYGGDRKFWHSVSAGDIYYELDFHCWLMEGLVPRPGRITRFSRTNDPIIRLLDISGIPLT